MEIYNIIRMLQRPLNLDKGKRSGKQKKRIFRIKRNPKIKNQNHNAKIIFKPKLIKE